MVLGIGNFTRLIRHASTTGDAAPTDGHSTQAHDARLRTSAIQYAIEHREKTPGETIGERVGVIAGKAANLSGRFASEFVRCLRAELTDEAVAIDRETYLGLYTQLQERVLRTDLNGPISLLEARVGQPTFAFAGDMRRRTYRASIEDDAFATAVTLTVGGDVPRDHITTLLDAYADTLLADFHELALVRSIDRTATDTLLPLGMVTHKVTYDGMSFTSLFSWQGRARMLRPRQECEIRYERQQRGAL